MRVSSSTPGGGGGGGDNGGGSVGGGAAVAAAAMAAAPAPSSSGERSVMDLRKLVEDFLDRIEGALHVGYDGERARKDYEAIMAGLGVIEKGMEERDMLNVSDEDAVRAQTEADGGVSFYELLQRALQQKSEVDAEFDKISAAAAAARAREQG